MIRSCVDASNQLRLWVSIRSEWSDRKKEEVEENYIGPLQKLLILLDEKNDEIDFFIAETEEKIQEIKEVAFYG